MVLSRDQRLGFLVIFAALPGALVSLALLWMHVQSQAVRWTLATLIIGAILFSAGALQAQIVRPLQTLSNMLAAIREGDYTLRNRGAFAADSFGTAMLEANAIAEALRGQRLDSLEASALFGSVMDEIEVAIFAFDPEEKLRFINRAGAALLAQPLERLLGRTAAELGLRDSLSAESPRTLEAAFGPGVWGRWEVRARTVRLSGLPHRLIVLSDLRRALREEERQAWQRLIRVLSHEINNSLTPIQSIAQSLLTMTARAPEAWGELKSDLGQGLGVIAGRADAVARFMAAYAQLARLPPPRLGPLEVGNWVRRVVGLETRLRVAIEPGPELTVQADGDQLDQLLINLVANAADAALETSGTVTVTWRAQAGQLEVLVSDTGPGIAETANLFVPFFTTKKSGSGIGLALSRQIAEGHGGTLLLQSRKEIRGCEARLRIPLGG